MSKSYGRYTHAIVSRIPSSFVSAIGSSDSINILEARKEHSEYTRSLRSLGLDVIELPADETLPDSPFVEDTAVVCNGNALLCRPGHPARAKEVRIVQPYNVCLFICSFRLQSIAIRLPFISLPVSNACPLM